VANTIIAVETSNTFNQWRIVTNSLVLAANELRNNTYIKEGGSLQISNGTLQVVNGVVQIDKSTGTNLYVAANATVVGTLTVGNVSATNFSAPQLTAAYNQANAATVQANAAFAAANNAANTVRVTANSGTAQSAVSLNFVNTSSVLVSVGAGSTGNANIAFSAVAGTTAVAGIVQLTDSSTSTSTTTAATPNSVRTANVIAVSAYTQANLAYAQTNTANSIAISAYGQANLAYTQANTANSIAISAYGQANAAYTQANTANSTAVSAYGQANGAFTTANNAANTVRVTSNSLFAQSAVGLNFINTASVTVSLGAGSAGTANVGFSAIAGTTAVAGILQLTDSTTSTSTTTAATPNSVKTAFDQATAGYAQANGAYNQANTAYTQANTARTEASAAANGVRVSQNYGSTVLGTGGINFSNTANIKISVTSGISGNANVSFDFPSTIASMSIGSLSVTTLTTTNPIVGPTETDSSSYRLRVSQTTRGDGTFGVNQGGANGNADIKFASSTGVWQLTSNSIAGAYYNIITSQNVSDSVTTTSSSNVASSTAVKSAFDQATAAFARANTANSTAVSAYGQANTANSIAISAYGQANLAYSQANTSNSIAISAYGQANAAFTTANNSANTVRVTANSGSTQSAVSLNFVNTATTRVSVGAGSAGTANISYTVIPTFTTEINTTSTLSVSGDTTLSSNLNVGGISNLGSIVSKTLDIAKIISNSTSIYNTTRISGIKPESLVYTGKYVNISAFDSLPTGVDFKTDGTVMFLSGQTNKKISQFSLSVPWDSSTATFSSQSAALTTIEGQPRGIAFSSDGANVYVQGAAAGNVTQYSLSTAWDVASLTVASNVAAFNVATALIALGGQQSALRGLAFSDDGVFMYSSQGGSNGLIPKILQYRLSTAFNVATASLTSNSGTSTSGGGLVNSTGSYGWGAAELNLINGGTVLQVLNVTDSVVQFYALDTPFDITKTKFIGKTPSIIETVPYGSFLSPDGKYLSIVGTADDNVYTFIANSTTSLGISGDTIVYGDVDIYGSLTVNDYNVLSQIVLGRNQANTANSIAISAYGQANLAYTQANTANSIAISAYGQANAAYTQANLAYTRANTANSIAISAYGQANLAYTQANTANSIAISAYGQANAAYAAANNAANTVRVTANSGSAQSAVSLNFVNTATVIVSVGAGTTGNANLSFSVIPKFTTEINTTSSLSVTGNATFSNSVTISIPSNAPFDALRINQSVPVLISNVGVIVSGTTLPNAYSSAEATAASGGGMAKFQAHSNTNLFGDSALASYKWRHSPSQATSGGLLLARAANNNVATYTAVSDDLQLGEVRAAGSEGTNFVESSAIKFIVDGAVAVGSVPGKIKFETTSPGGFATSVKMQLDSNGNLGIGNTAPNHTLSVSGNTFVSGAAFFTGTVVDRPVASIAASTSYAENAAGKTIVVNSASPVTLTFGTAAYSGFVVDIIRKGTGNVTIANTSTIAKLNVASVQPMSNISSRYATARVTYTATNEFILTGSITP